MFLVKHNVLSLLPDIVAEKTILPNDVQSVKCVLEKEEITTRSLFKCLFYYE